MIQNALAFFLSRYSSASNIYLTEKSEDKLHLAEYFKKYYSGIKEIEFNVFLGKRKLPVRLIAYRLPQEIVSRRRQALIKTAKRKGYKPSKEALENVAFSIYLTNVPSTICNPRRLPEAVRKMNISDLFSKCSDKILVSLCKQKRTRKTTLKQIDQEVGYLKTLEHWGNC